MGTRTRKRTVDRDSIISAPIPSGDSVTLSSSLSDTSNVDLLSPTSLGVFFLENDLVGSSKTERSPNASRRPSVNASPAKGASTSTLTPRDSTDSIGSDGTLPVPFDKGVRSVSNIALLPRERAHSPLATSTSRIVTETRDPPTHKAKIEVPDLEGTVRSKQERIDDDPLKSMLVPPAEEIAVKAVPRKHRVRETAATHPPQSGYSLFGRKCLQFYQSPWHVVEAEPFSALPEIQRSADRQLQFASESAKPNQSADPTDLFKLSEEPILSATLACALNQSKRDAYRTLTRKDTRLKSKAKKRMVHLRYKTSRGPLVLELIKEEKKKEDIDLSVATSIEVDQVSSDTFCINFEAFYCTFQCDDVPSCELWLNTIYENIDYYNRFKSQSHTDSLNASVVEPTAGPQRHTTAVSAFEDIFQERDVDDRQADRDSASVKNILSVYHVGESSNYQPATTQFKSDFLEEFSGERFTVTCEELLFRLHLTSSNGPTNPEPFYCSLQLYDLKAGCAVSERFYFDLNNHPQIGYCKLADRAMDPETRARKAAFSVDKPSADVFLVLVVEKTLQKEHNNVFEAYIKGQDEKAAAKQSKAAAAAVSRREGFRMPFALAIRNVFKPSHASATGFALDTESTFSSLFKHDTERYREEDLLKSIQEYQKSQGKLRLQAIPGHFTCYVEPYLHNVHTVTPSYGKVEPYLDHGKANPTSPPRREIMPFYPSLVQQPYLTYFDFVYIYPLSVNLNISSKKLIKSSARNIVCRICVLEDDASPVSMFPEGIPCIYGRSSCEKVATFAITTVQYHAKAPSFMDEVKIAVPPNVTPQQHVLFTFYHLAVKEKKKVQKLLTPIGHSFMPLSTLLSQPTQQRSMPVAVAHHVSGTDTLPSGYLSTISTGLGDGRHCSIAGNVATSLGLKYFEDGKELFAFRTRSISSVRSHDPHVSRFFDMCETRSNSARSDAEVSSSIKGLHAADKQQLFRFMPVIYNQLFSLLLDCPGDYSKVAENVIRYLLFANTTIQGEQGNKSRQSPLLHSYADHIFRAEPPHQPKKAEEDTPTTASTGCTIHETLIRHLPLFLKDELTKNTMVEFSWFFFLIIAKSMSQTIHGAKGLKEPRSKRFSSELQSALLRMFHRFTLCVTAYKAHGYSICAALNRSLASLVIALFPIADRGMCFKLVELYLQTIKSTDEKNSFLTNCRFEFIWLMCAYKEYFSLNLPLIPTSADMCTSSCNDAFKRRHYITWVLISNVSSMINTPRGVERERALATLRAILTMHDCDERYQTTAHKQRIAMLYFPIVHIALENTHRLKTSPSVHGPVQTSSSSTDTGDDLLRSEDGGQGSQMMLTFQESQDLLACFLFVLKNLASEHLEHFHSSGFNPAFFTLLKACVEIFKFRGRKDIVAGLLDAPISKKNAIKILEEDYANVTIPRRRSGSQSVALRSDWRSKRKQAQQDRTSVLASSTISIGSRVPASPLPEDNVSGVSAGGRLRLSTVPSKAMTAVFSKDNLDDLVYFQGQFSVEVAFVVLDMVELILEAFPDSVEDQEGINNIASACVELQRQLIDTNPSDFATPHIFHTVYSFACTFADVLFCPQVDYSQNLCLSLLNASNSPLPSLRHYAAALLYILLSKNIGRATQDVFVAISRLAGEMEGSDDTLRMSLRAVTALAAQRVDSTPPGFPQEVASVMDKLTTVLVNTAKFKKHTNEPDVLVDLQYDVAKSYATSPTLRLTWLESLASLQAKYGNWVESGMCIVHAACIVVQVLKIKNPASPYTLRDFLPMTRNVLMEKLDALAAEEAKTISSPLFTQRGLMHMLKTAVSCFKQAQCFEYVSTLYNIIVPWYQEQNRYADLSAAHKDLHECYESILNFNRNRTRHLGTYFRVAFFGEKLDGLDGCEFIYKEPGVTPLATVSLRLQEQYKAHANCDVEVISHSKVVERASLDASKVYLQITHVEPFFDGAELQSREAQFDRFVRLNKFIFETPYTPTGKARSDNVAEQHKRKTILTLDSDMTFPHLRSRLEVKQPHEVIDLLPIQVAADELEKKLAQLTEQLEAEKTNPVMLQIQLQGALTSQVNAGPMHYAEVFLGNFKEYEKKDLKTLSTLFEKYLTKLQAGVDLNQQVISEQQLGLQAQLRTGLADMQSRLTSLIPEMKRRRRRSIIQMPPSLVTSTSAVEPGINFLGGVLNQFGNSNK